MLTVMCPNCRHRFPAVGCCSSMTNNTDAAMMLDSATLAQCDAANDHYYRQDKRHVSGGGLVQDNDCKPRIFNGGGLVMQQPVVAGSLSSVVEAARQETRPLQIITEEMLRKSFEQAVLLHSKAVAAAATTAGTKLEAPPSGCQELPGTRREICTNNCSCSCNCCSSYGNKNNSSNNDEDKPRRNNVCQVAKDPSTEQEQQQQQHDDSDDIKIQLNATVQLPSSRTSGGRCTTFNFTATTSTTPTHNSEPIVQDQQTRKRIFNSGGNVSITSGNLNVVTPQPRNNASETSTNREDQPPTPISWVTPCPWGFDGGYDMVQKHAAKLAAARKSLQKCAWFYEGLTWQQSEVLLKDAEIGRWLLRDSSDSRYSFAISAQTPRGPTSVRVIYFMGKFRLDSMPGREFEMPMFDCPFKMLEYYCNYERDSDDSRAVWVDCQCKLFAHIHMTRPLAKKVQSLSHLARLAVNKSATKLEEQLTKLPPVIKSYLEEYPYTV